MERAQFKRDPNVKYPTSRLLNSSKGSGWSTLFAELRAHGRSDGPGSSASHAEVAITMRGGSEGEVSCKVGGSWRTVRPTTGTIWLRPVGAKSDVSLISAPTVQVMHLYVPEHVFGQLEDDYALPISPGRSIRYMCGAQDEIICQLGQAILSEMMNPTAAGRMLVETSSLFLAARLAHSYLDATLLKRPTSGRAGLDAMRLKRVLNYVEMHLADDITVSDLAKVACLSAFHFSRAFATSVGVPPHRYVSQRRLDHAKAAVATGRDPLERVAADCRFSSQSSFTRAFRRATGMTPGEYRRASR